MFSRISPLTDSGCSTAACSPASPVFSFKKSRIVNIHVFFLGTYRWPLTVQTFDSLRLDANFCFKFSPALPFTSDRVTYDVAWPTDHLLSEIVQLLSPGLKVVQRVGFLAARGRLLSTPTTATEDRSDALTWSANRGYHNRIR